MGDETHKVPRWEHRLCVSKAPSCDKLEQLLQFKFDNKAIIRQGPCLHSILQARFTTHLREEDSNIMRLPRVKARDCQPLSWGDLCPGIPIKLIILFFISCPQICICEYKSSIYINEHTDIYTSFGLNSKLIYLWVLYSCHWLYKYRSKQLAVHRDDASISIFFFLYFWCYLHSTRPIDEGFNIYNDASLTYLKHDIIYGLYSF